MLLPLSKEGFADTGRLNGTCVGIVVRHNCSGRYIADITPPHLVQSGPLKLEGKSSGAICTEATPTSGLELYQQSSSPYSGPWLSGWL